jgi:hypothetical protein
MSKKEQEHKNVQYYSAGNEYVERMKHKHHRKRESLTFGEMYLRAMCVFGGVVSLYLIYYFYLFNWFWPIGIMMVSDIGWAWLFKTTIKGENTK